MKVLTNYGMCSGNEKTWYKSCALQLGQVSSSSLCWDGCDDPPFYIQTCYAVGSTLLMHASAAKAFYMVRPHHELHHDPSLGRWAVKMGFVCAPILDLPQPSPDPPALKLLSTLFNPSPACFFTCTFVRHTAAARLTCYDDEVHLPLSLAVLLAEGFCRPEVLLPERRGGTRSPLR